MNDELIEPLEEENKGGGLDIAVVGMAGRFPGANNIETFWDLLKNGREAITYFTEEELIEAGNEPALVKDPDYVKSRCIIEDEDKFDAYFFDFSPREVELMDPQHRLFLEIAWQALENAGYNADEYDGLIGLFGGTSLNTYLFSYLRSQKGIISSAEGYQLSIGNDKDFLTTRISYKMNLKGPSVDVQTACSTSLVAVHMACQNLLNYNCDMALAGGVSITIPQKQGYYYQEGMILSPDGHCRAFDEKAGGTISGSGSGIVVLKRLDEAIEDGDHIYAVIKGSAYNNDGSMRVGYTAPSVDGQAEVIATAQSVAALNPDQISYMEAHGTGTVLGDPIEVTALTQVFNEQTDKKGYCAMGSVKTNIGHLDAAAGVAGLIKTVLALKNKQIPPSLNYTKPNPKIDFENSPFFVNTKLTDWKSESGPRRAGVSSFGIGGTNAHAVLEEAPELQPSSQSRPYQLLLLSTKTASAMETSTDNLAGYLKENPQVNLADAAYTLQVGRKPFNQRRLLVCESADDAASALRDRHPKRLLSMSHTKEPANPSFIFMFSGQGSQYVDMGKDLYENEPLFHSQFDECCELFKPYLNIDLRDFIFPDENNDDAVNELNQTGNTQPALFVIEYALGKLLMHWGIEPQAMVGHSIGEFVAACISGVFSLEDAVKVVAARANLMQKMDPGAMLSVPLEENELQQYLSDQISLAAINGKGNAVLSGAFEAIESVEKQLTQKGIEFRRLHTSHAFHSPMMEPVLDEFESVVAGVQLNNPKIPYVSNVSGTWITNDEATSPAYYAKHLRNAVRFADNVHELLQDNDSLLIEVGPGTALSTLARRHPDNTLGRVILSTMRHPREDHHDQKYLLNTLGHMWLSGAQINWNNFYEEEQRSRLPLPGYPFERQRYWLESKGSPVGGVKTEVDEGKKKNIADWFYIPGWKQRNLPLKQHEEGIEQKVWLVLKDPTGMGRNFADQIKPAASKLVTVEVGTDFKEIAENQYAMEIDNSDHFKKLFESLAEKDLLPDAIGHLWSIDSVHTENAFDDEHLPAFKSLLYLIQAMADNNLNKPLDLGIITTHLFEVTRAEPYKPGQSILLGLGKVIPQEFPNINCRIIDVKLPQGVNDKLVDLCRQLAAEFIDKRPDQLIAYRGTQRWVQQYEATAFENTYPGKGLLKENGVYLISGGLGRIGLTLAGYLASKVKAKLALVEHFDFPAKTEWPKWAENNDEDDITAVKIKRLQKIESNGAEVFVLKADLGEQTEVESAVNRVVETFGTLDGVIHAAGIVGDSAFKSLTEMKEDDWNLQFHAKIKGAMNIARTVHSHKPDFVLLQSSMSAILGGLGFGAYAAANAYLDALAYQQNKFGLSQWISVNWDGWQFDEPLQQDSGLGAEIAKLSVLPEEGLQVFERIFSSPGFTQILVSTGDLQRRIEKWIKLDSLHSDTDDETGRGELYSRPNLATAYAEPETDLQKQIVDEWQRLLGIEPVGIYDDFFDLGGNSLLGTQLIAKMRETFQIDVPLRSLFEDPTVSGVGKVIEEGKAKAESSEISKVADLLSQMENMSDEDAATMLKEKKGK